MKRHNHRCRKGVSLIESMIAAMVLVIGFMGAMQLRYGVRLSVRQGELQASAARASLLLAENWRGASNPSAFDPVGLTSSDGSSLVITTSADAPGVPTGFTAYGKYRVMVEDSCYYGILSYKDVAAGLRALNVTLAWEQRGAGVTAYADTDKTFTLTSYSDN